MDTYKLMMLSTEQKQLFGNNSNCYLQFSVQISITNHLKGSQLSWRCLWIQTIILISNPLHLVVISSHFNFELQFEFQTYLNFLQQFLKHFPAPKTDSRFFSQKLFVSTQLNLWILSRMCFRFLPCWLNNSADVYTTSLENLFHLFIVEI